MVVARPESSSNRVQDPIRPTAALTGVFQVAVSLREVHPLYVGRRNHTTGKRKYRVSSSIPTFFATLFIKATRYSGWLPPQPTASRQLRLSGCRGCSE